jgi:hypothetical protein
MYKTSLLTFLLLALAGSAALAQTLYVPGGTVGNISGSNVGIGTSSPSALLHVSGGGIRIDVNGGIALQNQDGAGNTLWSIKRGSSVDGNDMAIRSYSGFTFAPANTDAVLVRIANNGNVGIGTTDPGSYALNVSGPTFLGSGGSGTALTLGKQDSANEGAEIDWNAANTSFENWVTDVYQHKFRIFKGSPSTDNTDQVQIFNASSGTVGLYVQGNVGIGTTNPGSRLSVAGNIMVQGADGWSANGNIAKLTFGYATGSSDVTGIAGKFGSGLVFGVYSPGASGGALGSNSMDAMVIQQGTGNVGIGTSNPTYPLAVNGAIHAKEVIVDTSWSDYVFKPEYHLASLHEVQQSIEKEGHLPGIPSAEEVAEHGISVGDMQAKLLAKIEELTLHQIEQEKRQERLSQTVEQLQKENAELRTTLAALQKQ